MQPPASNREAWPPAGLTKQGRLFPTTIVAATHDEYCQAKRRLDEQRFEVKDDLLYACLTYGDGLAQGLGVAGFTDFKGLGYALLVFFVQQGLGVSRLPFCPDRIFARPLSGEDRSRYAALLSQLSAERVERVCAEVRALYDHTQRQLAARGLTTVRLRRCVYDDTGPFGQEVGYAETLFKLAKACEVAGRRHLNIEMDVLNSYGDDGAYGHYPVQIVREISARDVFYCSNLVKSRTESRLADHHPAVEEGEWIVINRSPTGVVELPVDCVQANTKRWADALLAAYPFKPADAARFVDSFDPFVLRTSYGVCYHAPYSSLRTLAMKPAERIRVALHVLTKGRFPR